MESGKFLERSEAGVPRLRELAGDSFLGFAEGESFLAVAGRLFEGVEGVVLTPDLAVGLAMGAGV
ncbi:MAG: hypothetical protein V4710_19290, partial [Verrucomicrobiota bacterium]